MVSLTSPSLPLLGLLSWLSLAPLSSAGPFTSIYTFGDGVCTTDSNPNTTLPYYETSGSRRYCNGRVWIEVLSEWLGLPHIEANNNSYFGHDSGELVTNTASFTEPTDVATALFIVWTSNADLVGYLNSGATTPPYDNDEALLWTAFIDQAVDDHETALTTLYDIGVRTIVLPTAVDIGTVPLYAGFDPGSKTFIRNRAIEFNAALDILAADFLSTRPDLTIHRPDTFAFLDDVIANPATYNLTVVTPDAITDLFNPAPLEPTLAGPGADYVFWDNVHPTAKVQMHLANLVQQQICPLTITNLSLSGGNTLLSLQNVPLERTGFVEGRTGPGPWIEDSTIFESFAAGSTNPTITFPSPTTTRLHRVHFPVNWSWP